MLRGDERVRDERQPGVARAADLERRSELVLGRADLALKDSQEIVGDRVLPSSGDGEVEAYDPGRARTPG